MIRFQVEKRLAPMASIYRVCIPNTARDFFDYHAEQISPAVGARVWVPFRNQQRLGLVIEQPTNPSTVKTKPILAEIDKSPLLSGDLLALCRWVSDYYQSPLSEVIALALPKKYRQGEPRSLPQNTYYELQTSLDDALSQTSKRAHRQIALLKFIAQSKPPVLKETILVHGFVGLQLKALLKQGFLIEKRSIEPPSAPPIDKPDQQNLLQLNPEQHQAVEIIAKQMHHHHCFLLQGVTGSGKTEVYLTIILDVLKQGKQVLFLVPEIGLTPQLLARFQKRLQVNMAVIHSQLNDRERQVAWERASQNSVQLIIGTRTAVFTPLPKLGLIVIDEEHDASLKQLEGVRYSARDTALMRAYQANVPIILGSATPSLESLYNCQKGKYSKIILKQKALSSTPLHYQILDIRNQSLDNGLATKTLQLIETHLSKKNQILVFINRRGFAPVLLCHECGWIADCAACDSHLTLHKQKNQLICHHCGRFQKIPALCPTGHTSLLSIGMGTQKVDEFLKMRFPHANVLRIDRDEVRKKKIMDQRLAQIQRGESQIIVGTQMLAKGHHFPKISLVVILDADQGFYNQDFRALERLGQLLTQVSGRAGRAEHPGQVVIQTHFPQHPLLNELIQCGYPSFAETLLRMRQASRLPPFSFLALIRAKGKREERVVGFLKQIQQKIWSHGLMALGPAAAPLSRKSGYHQMQLLLQSNSRKQLHHLLTELRRWLTMKKFTNDVRWNIDVDPIDLS